jgi:F0F1-type ATP synthase assembly protein I
MRDCPGKKFSQVEFVSTLSTVLTDWGVDGVLGTRPLLTIVGAFVGAGAGFYNLYRQLIVVPARREEERRKGGDGGG